MRVFTSNYASVRKFEEGLVPVAISAAPPSWYTGFTLKTLAPEWATIKAIKAGKITQDEYAEQYFDTIAERELTPEGIVEALETLYGGRDVVLLCYEAAGDFCHRRLIAEWLEKHLGIDVPEWTELKQRKQQEFLQDTLEF